MKKSMLSMMAMICVLSFMMVLTTLNVSAENGYCGINRETSLADESVVWEYDENTSTLVFNGNGYMDDYWGSDVPWYEYAENIKNVVISDGVKSIGVGALTGLYKLETLTVADSVENINVNSENGGGCAVNTASPYYKNEENWTDGILYSGNYLIATNSSKLIGNCKIKEGTKFIAMAAFNLCPELESVEIPDSVITLSGYTFVDCPKLKKIKFSAGIKSINFQTVIGCNSMESVTIPDGTELINNSFCVLNNLKEIKIPASVKNVDGSFYGCDQVTDVYYYGTREQWNKIVTEKKYGFEGQPDVYVTMSENNIFPNAEIHFVSKDTIKVLLNNEYIEFDQTPIIRDNRTLVPVRAIFEALGCTVDWNDETKTVTSVKDDITIVMTIDSNKMYKNGQEIVLDVVPQIVNSRTLVPVRAIAESFNCKVDWDEKNQTVIING